MDNTPLSVGLKTLSISATTSASASQPLPNAGTVIRVVNEGPNAAFISVGTGAQVATLPGTTAGTATGTSTCVLAGEDVVFGIPSSPNTAQIAATAPAIGSVYPAPTALNVSAICRSGTATVTVSVGYGS